MPTLFKRSNGVYYITYGDGGKRRWKSTGQRLKSEALRVLLDFRKSLQPKPQRISLGQFEGEFLAFASSNYSSATCGIYRRCLSRLRSLVGDVWLDKVTAKHIDEYKAQRLNLVSPVSVNVELRALKAAFYTAIRWKLLDGNPVTKVSLVRTDDRQPEYFSRDDFQRLISVIREQWLKDLILVAVCTGMRRAELLNLKWCDVDFERRVIHVQSNGSFRSKTGKRRVIPVSDVASQVLRSRISGELGEYVFTLRGEKISDNWATHIFKRYLRAAGLTEKLHFHSLRHTFATWLVQEGVPIYEVQKLLGHSSISVTQVYSHLAPSELHGAVNKIVLN